MVVTGESPASHSGRNGATIRAIEDDSEQRVDLAFPACLPSSGDLDGQGHLTDDAQHLADRDVIAHDVGPLHSAEQAVPGGVP